MIFLIYLYIFILIIAPDEPEEPDDPEDPLVPEVPVLPDVPDEPEEPDVPEDPNPDDPEEPEVPVNPELPDEPELPDDPELPVIPEEPDEPDDPEEPDEPDVPPPIKSVICNPLDLGIVADKFVIAPTVVVAINLNCWLSNVVIIKVPEAVLEFWRYVSFRLMELLTLEINISVPCTTFQFIPSKLVSTQPLVSTDLILLINI